MPHKTGHTHSHSHHDSPGHSHHHGPGHSHARVPVKRAAPFNKIFRWQQDPPGGPLPVKVEVVGSFNGWQKAPLKYDRSSDVWQLTVHDIPGNCTHNYMLLVNGRPVPDKNSDGLAVPHTPEEKQYQLETPRGPRVFMLFSQTK